MLPCSNVEPHHNVMRLPDHVNLPDLKLVSMLPIWPLCDYGCDIILKRNLKYTNKW